jgi:hypothetical protein
MSNKFKFNSIKPFFERGYWIAAMTIILVVVLLISSYKSIPKYRSGKITLGTIYDSWIASDSRYIKYAYVVENQKYKVRSTIWMKGLKTKGQYFYILYLPSEPNEHIILYCKPLIHKKELGKNYEMEISDREIFKGITGF